MKKSIKLIHWAPRIICLLAILLVSMFSLDAFSGNQTFWQKIGAFAMHLIPTYVLTIVLIIAWKWEKIGGILLMIIGLSFVPFIFRHNYNMNHSIGISLSIILCINFPFILAGFLFILSHYLKKKNKE